jgi:hypothetical protein
MKRMKANKPNGADPLGGLGYGWIVAIADYAETFEIREDKKTVRKSPALYSKWYGGANDEPSACYMRRIDKLTRRPDGLLLEGGWGRFLRAAGNHERTFRGYLTNDESKAATLEEIAGQILFCEESVARDTTLGLLEVGLIRIVHEPDWAKRRAELDAQAKAAQGDEKEGKEKAETKGKTKRATGHKKSAFRKNPETSGNFRKRSPNLIEDNLIEDNRNGRELKRNQIGIEGKSKGTASTQETDPTVDSPIPPAKSDAGAGPPWSGREACPASIPATGAGPPSRGRQACPTLGRVLKLSRYRYDPAAWAFADGVLLASGYRQSNGPDRECERSHWAKAWTDATAELPPAVLDRLKRAIVEQAATIHSRRADFENPEAYLMRSWHNNVRDAQRGRRAAGSG